MTVATIRFPIFFRLGKESRSDLKLQDLLDRSDIKLQDLLETFEP